MTQEKTAQSQGGANILTHEEVTAIHEGRSGRPGDGLVDVCWSHELLRAEIAHWKDRALHAEAYIEDATTSGGDRLRAEEMQSMLALIVHDLKRFLYGDGWDEERATKLVLIADKVLGGFNRVEANNRALLDKSARLRRVIKRAADELGVPQPGYPAPVANAASILRDALEPKP